MPAKLITLAGWGGGERRPLPWCEGGCRLEPAVLLLVG